MFARVVNENRARRIIPDFSKYGLTKDDVIKMGEDIENMKKGNVRIIDLSKIQLREEDV